MFPDVPPLGSAPQFTGHLWVQERPTGGWLGIQLADSGAVTVTTPAQSAPTMTAPELPYQQAVAFVRSELARAPLQAAVDDPTTITLTGIATWADGVDYDWDALPPFVGTDVYVATDDRFLTPDAATAVFDRVGLPAAPAVSKELPARQFDPAQYDDPDGFPTSVWASEPAAAVLVRDKAGNSGVAWRSSHPPEVSPLTVEACLEQLVTSDRIQRTATELRAAGATVTVDTVRDRLLASLAREQHDRLFGVGTVDPESLANRLSAVVHRHLDV